MHGMSRFFTLEPPCGETMTQRKKTLGGAPETTSSALQH